MNPLKYLRNKFLKFFGDIKIFKYPFFLLYDPGSYLVKGDDVRKVINCVQPGDILIRGYKNYLDGYFIPGFFSHAGLYLGKTLVRNDMAENIRHLYKEGEQTVIHSMAEGVFMEDIINFCRCDYLIILRRNKTVEPGVDIPASNQQVVEQALKSLGVNYDFEFDFRDSKEMSCTEFVYHSCKQYVELYGVKIKKKQVLFTKKEMIIPDDFITNKFDIAFKSSSIKQSKIDNILVKNSKQSVKGKESALKS